MSNPRLGHDLRATAGAGDVRRVEGFLTEGVQLDEPDEHGHTALCRAAIFGHVRVMSCLLEAGADANARDSAGLSVLILAAAFPRPEAVRFWMEART